MRIIRVRALLVIALSLTIFTSSVFVLDSLKEAPSSFAAEHGYVISSPGAPTIFSSSVDQSLASAINSTIQPASPEVFAFSSYNGVPFVVRGVDLALLDLTGPHFTEYERTDGGVGLVGNDAIIGSGLMKRLDVFPPCTLTVTSSYSSGFESMNVVGHFESQSSLDDELLVSLDSARALSGMGSGKVSIIRVGEPKDDLTYLAESGPRFALYDFRISKVRIAVGEVVNASVTLKNWGTENGRANFTFWDTWPGSNPVAIGNESLDLESGEERTIAKSFSSSPLGLHTIGVSFQLGRVDRYDVEPVPLQVEVISPYARVIAPYQIPYGASFTVTVTDYNDRSLSGAEVTFLNQTKLTGPNGTASLYAGSSGSYAVNVSYPGLSSWNATVRIRDISWYPNQFNPVIELFEVVPNLYKESESADVRVIVNNQGQVAGDFTGVVRLDVSSVIAELNESLLPGEIKTIAVPLHDVAAGDHTVSLAERSYDFTVAPWFADDSDFVQMAIKYGGKAHLSSAGSLPIAQAAKITQGDIEVALLSIGVVSGALAVLSTTSIFSKEIHEARSKLGILRTIGISKTAVRRMVIRQSLEISLPGSVAGIALGVGVAAALLLSGSLSVFGHELAFRIDASLVLPILAGTVAICLASSLASAEVAVRATPISSIRRIEEQAPERRTVDEVLGDE